MARVYTYFLFFMFRLMAYADFLGMYLDLLISYITFCLYHFMLSITKYVRKIIMLCDKEIHFAYNIEHHDVFSVTVFCYS